ncbi:MAG: hypothetical protein K0R44_34 [Thermomicrobiales bacterium]|nr:hypothetical protein [Thermomicrobiales bacterium]MDF3014809.1 hypothetical protein [Thermomicrobiales bacterium]
MGVTVPVIWLAKEGVCSRCRWDEWIVEDLLNGAQKRPATLMSAAHGTTSSIGRAGSLHPWVVVLPGGNHVDDVDWVNKQLSGIAELILFITSDEGAAFPVEKLNHPNMRLWIQTPRPEASYPVGTQFFGVGSARAWEYAIPQPKEHRAMLAGQRTHQRRDDAFANTVRVPNSFVRESRGFLTGLDRPEYLDALARSWWAPAPSGAITQDSFRFYEALELGTIPIPDGLRADGAGQGYWDMVAPGFPIAPITDWRRLPSLLDSAEQLLTAAEIELMTHGWWHTRRREMARTLASQVGNDAPHPLTVIVPTSPIKSHPSTKIIEETVRSIRERTDAEILITCDMPRSELSHYKERYTDYLRDLMLLAEHEWWNVTPIVMNKFCHQVEMLRRTLPHIDSKYLMYVEHDTPLVGDIDFDQVIAAMKASDLNVIRFYHEAAVHPEHEHLMTGAVHSNGWRPTMQWSQRPHVAKVSFYEKFILRHFETTARCMIEDAMFGIVEGAWLSQGADAWESWRMGLWHPAGDSIQRSTHLDGRGPDSKYEEQFKYRYRGDRPPGAPAGANQT